MSAEFVHLHLHTEYSLVDSVLRIKKAMPVIPQSMPAVALTDHCNLMGGVKFYRAALDAGLQPILGVDTWVGETTVDDNPHKLVSKKLAKKLGSVPTSHHPVKALVSGTIDGELIRVVR